MSNGKIIGLAILALVALPIIGGIYSTFSSVVTAPSRVINKTLETDNIISSYEWYHDAYGRFEARVSQVDQFQGLLADELTGAERNRLRIDLTAMQQVCRELAEQYNANSRKLNKGIFRGWSLPETLDQVRCG